VGAPVTFLPYIKHGCGNGSDTHVDRLDSNKLFRLLPQAHRDRFLAALRNPESDEAKELLQSATNGGKDDVDGRIPTRLPWWEVPDILEEGQEEKNAASPEMIGEEVLGGIKAPSGTGVRLAYNAITIWCDGSCE
jgi:hypothetical protein